MSEKIIPVYLMPGMAANPTIFEYINLPKAQFKVYWLEWVIPLNNESLVEYAERMANHVIHDNSVLIGVSFGGILVQEMSAFLNLRKLIIISSVKNRHELPHRIKFARYTKAYKLAPTHLAKSIDVLARFSLGKSVNRRVELYKKYLSINDKRYLDWAIKQVVCWDRNQTGANVVHIHGDGDAVFPIKHIKDCITIKGGTHVMIINKYKWFNIYLPKLILE